MEKYKKDIRWYKSMWIRQIRKLSEQQKKKKKRVNQLQFHLINHLERLMFQIQKLEEKNKNRRSILIIILDNQAAVKEMVFKLHKLQKYEKALQEDRKKMGSKQNLLFNNIIIEVKEEMIKISQRQKDIKILYDIIKILIQLIQDRKQIQIDHLLQIQQYENLYLNNNSINLLLCIFQDYEHYNQDYQLDQQEYQS
ncbi:unnamed protein product [Paramecium sonneborni]|uniref:Uncharacterized protein n=1 Tax=Paramecium sonneborni TaxID=65129 RepID=A0A8S1PEZ6_9CILI|nr:unnamed protein product [Paramecium sonneborni]